jgi:hypothetical protein
VCSREPFVVCGNGLKLFTEEDAELVILILYRRGRYTKIDFQVIMEAAKAELMNFVGKEAL